MDFYRILCKPVPERLHIVFAEIQVDMYADDVEGFMIRILIEKTVQIHRVQKQGGIFSTGQAIWSSTT